MQIIEIYRLNRKSCDMNVLDLAHIIFNNEPLEYIDFNDFGGESAHSFLGVTEDDAMWEMYSGGHF